tara:strand:+ start:21122 stop:21709 length:588 start_codon:yes stop_codon:yes gene_type:complete
MFATTRAITHARETRAVNATANSRRRTGRVVVARAAETTKEQKVRTISIRSAPGSARSRARARMDGWMDDARARAPTRGTRRTRRGCAEKNNVRRVARVRSIVRSSSSSSSSSSSFVSSRGTRARATREGSREDAVDVDGRRSRDDDEEEDETTREEDVRRHPRARTRDRRRRHRTRARAMHRWVRRDGVTDMDG